jgi:3-methyladenine DNA glycosylase/8-oxoguanine DNA glycosylase
MFLLINLERPDILPIGDLGIRSAVQRLYRLDQLPTPREVDAIGEKWRPNRSLASLYLWASTRQAPKPVRGAAKPVRQTAKSAKQSRRTRPTASR